MSSAAMGKPDVHKREVAIINYLREREQDGATARAIFEQVSAQLGDTVSRPAYYKLLGRLVAAGKIEVVDDGTAQRYVVSAQIHETNRLTLDDVYEMLPFVESSEALARAVEAQQYYVEHQRTTLQRTAQALTTENAVDLFFLWIEDLIDSLDADLAIYQHREPDGQLVFADTNLEGRIRSQCERLRNILYRYLSIPHEVVDLPLWEGIRGLRQTGTFARNMEKLKEVLHLRVFGVGEAKTVIGLVTVPHPRIASAKDELLVSGSDGSFHAGTLGLRTAQGYIEDESSVVTFNNSVAFVRSSERLKLHRGDKQFVHSAPLTRQTMDDPTYKGMVLVPFMFPMLTESEYEHMTRTATDVVQMRVDDEVTNGTARDVATGEEVPKPRVHIRDGTITPQDRGFNHYILMNPYGEITREGIRRSRNILQRIVTARKAPQVYAGAVKATQIRLFSHLINWYITRGSKLTKGEAIDATWDISRADYIADTKAMTVLLSTLEPRRERDGFWLSCVIIRQFPSLTDFYDTHLPDGEGWLEFLQQKRRRALEDYEQYPGVLPYHALLSEDELYEDSYLYMLETADYASFYIGHTSGEPAPQIPRYEFLCSLRNTKTGEQAEHVVRYNLEQLVTALLVCDFSLDRDHNFLSKLSLVKLIPSVVYRAHEFAKHLGKKLESEFKSIVVARLAERRKQRIEAGEVDINPVGVVDYLKRFTNARKHLPPPERDQDDENR